MKQSEKVASAAYQLVHNLNTADRADLLLWVCGFMSDAPVSHVTSLYAAMKTGIDNRGYKPMRSK
jgi:adenine deaminase